MAQRRRQVGSDGRIQHALGRPDDLDVSPESFEGVEQNRRRGLAADEPGRRSIVRPADPHGDCGPPVEPDRQRIAEAVGGPGLEGDAPA